MLQLVVRWCIKFKLTLMVFNIFMNDVQLEMKAARDSKFVGDIKLVQHDESLKDIVKSCKGVS